MLRKILAIILILSFTISNGQTRYYLNTGTTSPVAPAFNAGWNVTTGAIQYRMSEVKDGSALANNTSAAVGAAAVRKVLIDQWVSDPLAAQTITGTFTGQIRYDISSTTSTTGQGFVYLRIISNNGSTIITEVGTCTTTDLSTATTNRTLISLNVGTLTINAGERICVDIGWNYSVGTNTTRTAFVSTGSSSATDLPANNTETAAQTPWLEFSDNITLLGTDYYVATTGSDAAAGTIGAPFATWQKLGSVLQEGDRGWVRGGRYTSTASTAAFRQCDWSNINGTALNPITISKYPAETPIFDFAGFVLTTPDAFAVYMDNCTYLTTTGLRIANFAQEASGTGVSRGLAVDNSNQVTINQWEIDSMGGSAFVVGASNNVTFNYCDAHHLADALSTPAYGGADGYAVSDVSPTGIVFNGCRAWWCSDDGFESFNSDAAITYDSCWSFWNGFIPGGFSTGGNGEGFKMGSTATSRLTDTLRRVYNCLAFKNRTTGFGQNTGRCLYSVLYCTSYDNGFYGFWWGWEAATIQSFKNNCSYANDTADLEKSGSNVPLTYNSWNGTITVSDADFLSVSSTGMDGARGTNGALPVTNFMKLATGSDLINAGSDVGRGNDVNVFQYVSTTRYKGRIF